MNFISYGNKNDKSILFIHGLASTAQLCFGELLPYLQDYYVVLCELDGHCPTKPNDVSSLEKTIDKVENYILDEMGGKVYGICGFSMGATIAVELISRGKISAQKVLLDAAITVELGWIAPLLTRAFVFGANMIKNKRQIPRPLLNMVMGKDNESVVEMFYEKISEKTIKNCCKFIYHYKISENLKNFTNPVLFWRGSNEPLPLKSETILKKHLVQMNSEVFEKMGHGQFLHENPREYAKKLRKFFDTK